MIVMYGYYYDYSYWIYMLITLSISMYANFKVQSTFNKYSKVKSTNGLTGAEAAKKVLLKDSVGDVSIGHVKGKLTDHYDPRNNSILLSDEVYSSTSISAIGVAAHEAGHAVQNAQGYLPIRIRQFLVPISQFGSSLAMPLVFIGLLLPVQYNFVVNIGIMLFSLAVLFQIVTLPVEFNASSRAIKALSETGVLYGEEVDGAKEVLKAAALTYLAATFTALLSLLRLLLISRRRER